MKRIKAKNVQVGNKAADTIFGGEPEEVVAKRERGDLVDLSFITPENSYTFHQDDFLLVQNGA